MPTPSTHNAKGEDDASLHQRADGAGRLISRACLILSVKINLSRPENRNQTAPRVSNRHRQQKYKIFK